MRELSLFSGAGGGLLGSLLLGWEPIGYVEFNDYCQRVIAQRIADGILPNAPIFGDVRAFVSEGYAASYQGMVDVLSGGFPCQPFSVAGKRAGADDPRNMWPATAECVRLIRPRYCFFENVPGLLNSGYFGTVVADLAACGYGVRWRVLSAAEVGAPHKRDRLWIVAHAQRAEWRPPSQPGQSDTDGEQRIQARWHEGTDRHADVRPHVAHAAHAGLEGQRQGLFGQGRWWRAEPEICRVVDGYAGRVAELQAAGNAQVPAVAATAWQLLTEDLTT